MRKMSSSSAAKRIQSTPILVLDLDLVAKSFEMFGNN